MGYSREQFEARKKALQGGKKDGAPKKAETPKKGEASKMSGASRKDEASKMGEASKKGDASKRSEASRKRKRSEGQADPADVAPVSSLAEPIAATPMSAIPEGPSGIPTGPPSPLAEELVVGLLAEKTGGSSSRQGPSPRVPSSSPVPPAHGSWTKERAKEAREIEALTGGKKRPTSLGRLKFKASDYDFPPLKSDAKPLYLGHPDPQAPFRPAWGLRNKDTIYDIEAANDMMRHLPLPDDEKDLDKNWTDESVARLSAHSMMMAASFEAHMIRRYRQSTRLNTGYKIRIKELEKTQQELEKASEEGRNALEEKQKTVEELEDTQQRLEAELLGSRMQVDNARKVLHDVSKKNENFQAECSRAQEERAHAQSEVSRLSKLVSQLTDENSRLLGEVTQAARVAVEAYKGSEEQEQAMFEYSIDAQEDGFKLCMEKMQMAFPDLDLSMIKYEDDEAGDDDEVVEVVETDPAAGGAQKGKGPQ